MTGRTARASGSTMEKVELRRKVQRHAASARTRRLKNQSGPAGRKQSGVAVALCHRSPKSLRAEPRPGNETIRAPEKRISFQTARKKRESAGGVIAAQRPYLI